MISKAKLKKGWAKDRNPGEHFMIRNYDERLSLFHDKEL